MRRANKLSTKERDTLQDWEFAIPEERKFPIQDESQAKTALSMSKWPKNLKWRARVEKAVAERYPQLVYSSAAPIRTAPRRKPNCGCAAPKRNSAAGEFPVTAPRVPRAANRAGGTRKELVIRGLEKLGWTVTIQSRGAKCFAYPTDPNNAVNRYVIESDSVRAQVRTGSGWVTKQTMSLAVAARMLEGK